MAAPTKTSASPSPCEIGQMVRVDGSYGLVTILDSAE
jgi:hypothetical protein